MHADTEMEGILARSLGHILVGADASSFECFTRQLFVLVRHQVTAERELVDGGTLATQVENTNLYYESQRNSSIDKSSGAPSGQEHHGCT